MLGELESATQFGFLMGILAISCELDGGVKSLLFERSKKESTHPMSRRSIAPIDENNQTLWSWFPVLQHHRRLQPGQTSFCRKLSSRSARSMFGVIFFLHGATMSTNAAAVRGATTQFQSSNGIEEHCVVLDRMPGAVYSDDDRAQENAFCGIDFNAGSHALCPKVFSTSPGTLVYDISRGEFAGKPQDFESSHCASSSPVKRGALGEPVSYKMTMNEKGTSGTFSTASLLYYHFSRFLDAQVHVPVSVYRSTDRHAHQERVIRRGLEVSAHRKGGAMNHSGWEVMKKAAENPASYHPVNELLTADQKQFYGVLLHPQGDRYNAEVNGTRTSGWGKGQNLDFQETAPFLALRSEEPLQQAIEAGIHEASKNATLRKAMRHGVAGEQMAYWMQELTEITLLDFIFSQQDRIGNIDYLYYWYWVDDGEIRRRPASGSKVPEDIASHHPVRLRRTQLNDNDAGGRLAYANFTKQTGMLEKIRHYNPGTYRRLMRLANDFEARGELYDYVQSTFGLSDRQFRQILNNTRLAAGILRDACHVGELRFDLDATAYLVTGKSQEYKVDCDNP